MSVINTTGKLCRMIKIEHSIFGLPFAYCGAFSAARGWPGWHVMVWLTVAMVAIRSFAMTVNRLSDIQYDAMNPRTSQRELVTGAISIKQAWIFSLSMGIIFIVSCALLHRICLQLSPVAIAMAAGYSFMKRFTYLCHFGLGVVLALAPLAGWLSVQGNLALPVILLFLTVVFWVAGFDILYAAQDAEFDKKFGLHSIPARFGTPTALLLSTACHINAAIFLWLFGYAVHLSSLWNVIWLATTCLLYWEHSIISSTDMRRVNAAFFTINGIVSLLICGGVIYTL